jgi:hypothetical protein
MKKEGIVANKIIANVVLESTFFTGDTDLCVEVLEVMN